MQDKTGNLRMSFVIVVVIVVILLIVIFIAPLFLDKAQDDWNEDNDIIIELTK